ncbi:phosphodiester glycosidase family protein [Promicromonospora sp. NPDC060204]|uniref:phosphodiester glycosidase family protein n=1 Tax=Promicromonospora sp. NPDC060204 TaxID=3347071 RepID=UPI003668F155
MSTPNRPARRRRRIALAITVGLLLPAAGGAAWAADRFLVEHVEISDVSAYEAEQGTTAATDDGADADATVTDDSYTSDDTGITVSQVSTGEGDDTVTYYVADVQVDDATQLRSAFAQDEFGTNITDETSDIADDVGAVLAVNGDYYGFRDTGIVIRNGVVYRDDGAREGLAFYTDGHAEVYDETTTTADELVADGVWNTVSFGPALVEDGAVVDGIEDVEVDTNVGNHSIQGEQPRTAIGVIDENHYVIVVVDGRQEGYSRGVTLTELAQIMTGLGATTAYNLDGGGSSTLWFDGEVVNQPSHGGERATSDILYVAG